MLEASRRKIDLLVADYLLPGMSGVELMRKVKVRNPELKVIFISGMTDRKSRDEMLNAGGLAIFDKPIPLADFLDAVERGLGLVQTIFPPETNKESEHRQSLSDLLGGFRQKIKADAVFLISDRARVLARAGDLHDSSMEVSLLSALMAIYAAGLKVTRAIHQDRPENFHVFRGGDHDLILIPVDVSHALLLAGKGISNNDRILQTVEGMLFVRGDIESVLRSLGVAPEPVMKEAAIPEKDAAGDSLQALRGVEIEEALGPEPEVDVDALFATASKAKTQDLDAFWDDAVEKVGNLPINRDVITFEEAQKLGLDPGKSEAVARQTGTLKRR